MVLFHYVLFSLFLFFSMVAACRVQQAPLEETVTLGPTAFLGRLVFQAAMD